MRISPLFQAVLCFPAVNNPDLISALCSTVHYRFQSLSHSSIWIFWALLHKSIPIACNITVGIYHDGVDLGALQLPLIALGNNRDGPCAFETVHACMYYPPGIYGDLKRHQCWSTFELIISASKHQSKHLIYSGSNPFSVKVYFRVLNH